MRILIAHEAASGAGGVEAYLSSLMPALAARGHHVALLHYRSRSQDGPTNLLDAGRFSASVVDDGLEDALRTVREWHPDVCFSHNMQPLEVDERLAALYPTVKMLHGYFGTCVSGHKAHAFPSLVPCSRTFGVACLALYAPRRCGQLRPARMLAQYTWASRQRALFHTYSHVVVASAHMAREYRTHGVRADAVTVAPLFPTAGDPTNMRPVPVHPLVLFMGRMTNLKGPAVLARAVGEANRLSSRSIRVVFAGDGPEKPVLQQLTRDLRIDASFPGWLEGEARSAAFRSATLLAVPSRWPEPFGLAGLDAAAHGVPAVAFDVGGVGEWLRDGESGRMVRESDPRAFGRVLAELCSASHEIERLGEGAQQVARTLSLDAHLGTLERVFAHALTVRAATA